MNVPHIYGMLYVDGGNSSHVNLRSKGAHALGIYVRNAVTAARTASAVGLPYALITNDVAAVRDILASEGLEGLLQVREHRFTLDVPKGIRFYSAHFKLDVIKSFGTGDFGDLVALVDIDVIFKSTFDVPTDKITAYDISDAVFSAYGHKTVADDLKLLANMDIDPRWFGGEFIAGPSGKFIELAQEIDAVWPRYCEALDTMHHVGDEAIVSAALCRLMAKKSAINDAGAADIIARYWSTRTLAPMPSLAQHSNCAILHLPADKDWLAVQAQTALDPEDIPVLLKRHVRRRQPAEFLKRFVDVLRGRPWQHLPRLG